MSILSAFHVVIICVDRLMCRYIKRSKVSYAVLLQTVGDMYCIYVFRNPKEKCVSFEGTASVIIALTDGELNEWQFDTAQREVREVCHEMLVTLYNNYPLLNIS